MRHYADASLVYKRVILTMPYELGLSAFGNNVFAKLCIKMKMFIPISCDNITGVEYMTWPANAWNAPPGRWDTILWDLGGP